MGGETGARRSSPAPAAARAGEDLRARRALLAIAALGLVACAGAAEPPAEATGASGASLLAGCAPRPARMSSGTGMHAGPSSGQARAAASALAGSASASAGAELPRPGRTPLGSPSPEPLDFIIEPTLDGGSVLFIAKTSSDRAGWARLLDGATGVLGPLVRLDGEDVVAALSPEAGAATWLTSQGGALCIATIQTDHAAPLAPRSCRATRARAVAAVGDRIALLELMPSSALAAASAAGKPATAGAEKASGKAPEKKARKDKDPPRHAGARKKPKPRPKPRKKKGPSKPAILVPGPQPEHEVVIRWATRAGSIDADIAPTGLRFRPPLEGMALIDAGGRPGAIDVLHYADAPRRGSKSPFGRARIVGATLGEDGRFDATRRAFAAEADLEYGFLRGHEEPRLFVGPAGAAYAGVEARGGRCEAARIAPSFARFVGSEAACLVNPARLATATPLLPAELSAMERILGLEPRRAPYQPRQDPGLAAWAGDRAWFQVRGELFSASGADGQPRREPHPFTAQRAHIAWGAFAPDGEGLAFAAGQLRRVRAADAVAEDAGAPKLPGAGPGKPASLSTALAAPEHPLDRRRAARIGAAWYLARTDVVRLLPDAAVLPDLRGRAHPDSSALVGGPDRGLFIEVLGDALRLTAVAPSGDLAPLPPARAPVRAGFDACERRGGGVLVAGVSAAHPGKVVAFTLDAAGRPGPARPTSLPIRPGDLAVRLVPLPSGGALLSDRDRRHVVWLSDDAEELAAKPWPLTDSGAACIEGRPARREIPAPAPGRFVALSEIDTLGLCSVGDPLWAPDGTLRWFGSSVQGSGAQPELGVARPPLDPALTASAARLAAPAPAAAATAPPPAASFAWPPACPADMVAIAGGRFCVDRFESPLVDAERGELLSPDYPPTPNLLEHVLAQWSTGRRRLGDVHARAMPLPFLPAWQRGRKIDPVARPRLGARPSGYITGLVAEAACRNAGKRLCHIEEFVLACRGEDNTLYPYGDTFEDGACNVYRDGHPAAILHDNASLGHLDPRLNRVRLRDGDDDEPLFREAGAAPRCRSRWGSDAVYDMVGNLDEWVDDPDGAFAGGFYARSTRAGCEALVTAHPRTYADYSTGVRCCLDAPSQPQAPQR